jgi:hypothetical protein
LVLRWLGAEESTTKIVGTEQDVGREDAVGIPPTVQIKLF